MTSSVPLRHAAKAVSTGIGQFVPRKEDQRLLTGKGSYSDDTNLPDQLYAAIVRSPHAHAKILSIAVDDALSAPDVVAVLTGADLLADGLKPIPHAAVTRGKVDIPLENRDGPVVLSPHYPLPAECVRFVGEAVAIVIAKSVMAAKTGAEMVFVDYDPLPAVVDAATAIEADAPRLWDDRTSNVCLDAEVGDAAATEAAFRDAAHVVKLDTWITRVTGVPMEPRAVVANYDAQSGRYTLHAGSGNAVRQKRELSTILNVPEESVRVIARDVGGNFGTRNAFYPEFALVAWASKRLGKPVKWTCERTESFLSDYQGRDLTVRAELALDQDGNFLAIRSTNISNVGAYTVAFGPLNKGVELMSSVYRIPVAHVRALAVFTNTPPTNSYRSSGRPEAMFVMERLIDLACRQCGFDRLELRRRNLIPENALPFKNPLGLTYDSGAYEQVMDKALALGEWDGFAARKAAARQQGRLRGIGVANYIEITSGIPRERVELTVMPEGRINVTIGTLSSGQGHETSFAQLITEWLGVSFDCVNLVTGDTDKVPVGGGSHAGRSMRLAGIIIGKASATLVAKGKRIAAFLLDANEADVEFTDGRFAVPGTNRSFDLFEIAAAAAERQDLPDDLRGSFSAECDETVNVAGFPFGSHVCEVEIDPETGILEIIRYVAVDDVGRAINPLILHGQARGGIAQGLGQALSECCAYDRESGQLLSGSFMDYAMPRAHEMPAYITEISEVPSPTNPLGIRAGGEGGTTPALAVTINAIVDALAEFGVTHMEIPATPERIWRAIQDGQTKRTIS